jgi:hypothetical protein
MEEKWSWRAWSATVSAEVRGEIARRKVRVARRELVRRIGDASKI